MSFGRPILEKSPAWMRTSPWGTTRLSVRVCVSAWQEESKKGSGGRRHVCVAMRFEMLTYTCIDNDSWLESSGEKTIGMSENALLFGNRDTINTGTRD